MDVSKTYKVRPPDLVVIQYLLYLEFGVTDRIRVVSQSSEFIDSIELTTFGNTESQIQKCYKFFERVVRQLENPNKIYEVYDIQRDSGVS